MLADPNILAVLRRPKIYIDHLSVSRLRVSLSFTPAPWRSSMGTQTLGQGLGGAAAGAGGGWAAGWSRGGSAASLQLAGGGGAGGRAGGAAAGRGGGRGTAAGGAAGELRCTRACMPWSLSPQP